MNNLSNIVAEIIRKMNLAKRQAEQAKAKADAAAAIAATATAIQTLTAATTLGAAHHTVLLDASGAAVPVTLPAASTCSGRIYKLLCINDDNGASVVGTVRITDAVSQVNPVLKYGDELVVQSDGTSWWKLLGNTNFDRIRIDNNYTPASSVGAAGDREGDLCSDDDYIYHCMADYDGVTSIWERISWNRTPW